MRTMLRLMMDTSAGNAAIRNRDVQNVIEDVAIKIHPVAASLYPSKGRRCALFVFDMTGSSDISEILGALFVNLGAGLELTPVMNSEDLRTGRAARPG